MAYVLALLAIGLAFAAWRARDRFTRGFLIAACLLNVAGAVHMVVTDYDHAYELQPQTPAQPGDQDAAAMPDRR